MDEEGEYLEMLKEYFSDDPLGTKRDINECLPRPNFNYLTHLTHLTHLTNSIKKGYISCVKFLIERGADVNFEDELELRPLNYAIEYLVRPPAENRMPIVELLLENGARAYHEGFTGFSALGQLIFEEKYDCARLLISYFAKFRYEEFGTKTKDMDLFIYSFKYRNFDHKALNICKFIFENSVALGYDGGDIFDETETESGETMLHSAVWQNFKAEFAKFILECNPNIVNVRNRYGVSPLRIAVDKGNSAIVRTLLEYGADPRIEDDIEVSCLTLLQKGKLKEEIADILREWEEPHDVKGAI